MGMRPRRSPDLLSVLVLREAVDHVHAPQEATHGVVRGEPHLLLCWGKRADTGSAKYRCSVLGENGVFCLNVTISWNMMYSYTKVCLKHGCLFTMLTTPQGKTSVLHTHEFTGSHCIEIVMLYKGH